MRMQRLDAGAIAGRWRGSPLRPALLAILACAAMLIPGAARAQCTTLNPPCVNQRPHPEIQPATGTYGTPSVAFTVDWTDDKNQVASRSVTLNGTDVSASFTGSSTWTGTLTLASGSNTVKAHACDQDGLCGDQLATIRYTPPPAQQPYGAPAVSVRSSEAVRPPSPVDAVAAYATPAYVSRDEERSVTLLYTATQAQARMALSMDVHDNSVNAPTRFSIEVRDSASAQTVAPESFYVGQAGSNVLGAAWKATGATTGVRTYDVIVRSYWDVSRGAPKDTVIAAATVRAHLLVLNEASSPYGAGWVVAGVQRAYAQPNGDVVIANRDGSVELFRALGNGAYQAPEGDFSRLVFTAAGNVSWTRTWPDGRQAMFDGNGRMIYAYDRFGAHTDFAYDASGRVSTITDPAGKVTAFTYIGFALFSITDPGNRASWFTRDGFGNLTDISTPDGVSALHATYDNAGHRLLTRTARGGAVAGFAYDAAGLLAADTLPAVAVEGVGTPQRPVVRVLSPEAKVLGGTGASPAPKVPDEAAELTDPRGSVTKITFDAWAQPAFVQAPYDTTTIFRNPQGQPVRVIAPTGAVTTYAWSGPDLLHVHESVPGGVAGPGIDRHHDFWPDTLDYHLVTKAVDDGAVTHSRYGAHGELLRAWAGTDSTRATVYTYDAADRYRLKTSTDPLGHQTTWTYEAAGAGSTFQNLASTSEPHPEGGVVSYNFTYDGMGRTTVAQNPTGFQRFAYDLLNRDTLAVDEENDSTHFAFPSDSVATVRDATGKLYTYNTNQLGWLKSEVHPDGASRSYGYDVGGNVLRATDRRGTSVTFTYDAIGRAATRTADGVTTTFTYGTARNPWTSAVNAATNDTIFFDLLGRVRQESSRLAGILFTRGSQYAKEGPRTLLTYTNNTLFVTGQVSWTYDNSLLLTQISTPGAYGATTIGYNSDGLPGTVSIPLSSTSTLTQTTTYTGTHMPRTVQWSAGAVNGAVGHKLAYDGVNRVMRRSDVADMTSRRNYLYDYVGRLTYKSDVSAQGDTVICTNPSQPSTCHSEPAWHTDSTVVYGYDRVGNRTDSGAAMVANTNRYSSFAGYTLGYDAEGNLTSKTKTGYSQTLTWNALGQLATVTTNGVTVGYTYDGFGRRVKRDQGGTVNWFVYDGDDLLLELDGSGALLREYAYWPGTDQPHSMQVWSGGSTHTKYYYAMEHPGNVTGLINAGSQVVNQYHYTPWGVAETNTSETVPQPLRYMGRELDATTGLYYVRARWYDPTLGRFNSEDPIGLDGGINPYAYAGNGPVNGRDPSGLEDDETIAQCIARLKAAGAHTNTFIWQACVTGFSQGTVTATAQEPRAVNNSQCHSLKCEMRYPTTRELNFALATLNRLPTTGFCGRVRASGLAMVNRQLLMWDNLVLDRLNSNGGPMVGEAPWDYSRGGPVMYLYSRAKYPAIAVVHEAVHGVVRSVDSRGIAVYYADPNPADPHSPNLTPYGDPNATARACLAGG